MIERPEFQVLNMGKRRTPERLTVDALMAADKARCRTAEKRA